MSLCVCWRSALFLAAILLPTNPMALYTLCTAHGQETNVDQTSQEDAGSSSNRQEGNALTELRALIEEVRYSEAEKNARELLGRVEAESGKRSVNRILKGTHS